MNCDSPYIVIKAGTKSTTKNSPQNNYTIYNHDVKVNCGKCVPCRKRRVNDWVFRLLEEDKISSSSYFITLTYDTEWLPRTKNGLASLKKRDYQLFMKRLRKAQSKKYPQSTPIKFYAVGEYGTTKFRPHYHVIMFNLIETEMAFNAWNLGGVHVGNVSGASTAYTCKYIDKPTQIPLFDRDDRVPEFSLMSKNLGLGFLTKDIKNHYLSDITKYYLTLPDGKIQALPKYYRDKIFEDHPNLKRLQTKYIQKQVEEAAEDDITAHYKKYPTQSYEENRFYSKKLRDEKFYKYSKRRKDLNNEL